MYKLCLVCVWLVTISKKRSSNLSKPSHTLRHSDNKLDIHHVSVHISM